jgi:hypothetical protein
MHLIAMVKDEGIALKDWLSHVISLFDVVHIVDHGSTDGSREILTSIATCFSNVHL